MSPTQQVSKLLKISYVEAESYCQRVRSFSGMGNKLPYRVIANILATGLCPFLGGDGKA
jgi:hypothetical protein